jgi:hypothetical protein
MALSVSTRDTNIIQRALLCYGEYTCIYDCKLKKFREKLLKTLAHNQHDVI